MLHEWLEGLGSVSGRYVLLAGLTHIAVFHVLRQQAARRRVRRSIPPRSQQLNEFFTSFIAICFIAFAGSLMTVPSLQAYFQTYTRIGDHGTGYLILSTLALIVFQDFYFYWTHRVFHWGPVYRWIHYVHHRSHNPSAWSAFSFHPVEAFIHGLTPVLFSLVMPLHPIAISVFLLYMTAMTVMGHCGYEMYPRFVIESPLGKWLGSATAHGLHHKNTNEHYGLYLHFWDAIMGTLRPGYYETLVRVGKGESTQGYLNDEPDRASGSPSKSTESRQRVNESQNRFRTGQPYPGS